MKARIDDKRSNRALLVVLVVASLFVTTLWFREGKSGPLHLARRATMTVTEPVSAAGDIAASPFRSVGDWARGLRTSRSEVDTLREQNRELRSRLAELEEAKKENDRLRQVVQFARRNKLQAKAASVIGRPVTSWERSIFLDVGRKDGVEPGMPVIGADGLLGQVIEASSRSSRVRLITDQNSGVAAFVQSTRAAGIVRGSLRGRLNLDYVERKATPEVGDVIVTSGLGGVYPKGIPVGEVVEVSEDRSGLYPKIEVASRVDIGDVEEVLVLTQPAPEVKVGDGE